MDLIQQLQMTWPPECWRSSRMILAVSGGADSVAMLRAIEQLATHRELIQVAHFNHGWRGMESDADQAFVADLCRSLELTFLAGRSKATEVGHRTEQAARIARYQFLKQVAHQHRAQYVVTAHTASDRVETMLHNLCRGTGLTGVCTPRFNRSLDDGILLIRPLIECFREQVMEYLSISSQNYRQDTSNMNERYRRNFMRQSVLPLLEQTYGANLQQRLMAYSQLAEESLELHRESADRYWQQVDQMQLQGIAEGWLSGHLSGFRIPCRTLIDAPWLIVLIALQQRWSDQGWHQQSLTRRHWQQIQQYWQQLEPPAKLRPRLQHSLLHLPDGVEVHRCNGWIEFQVSRKASSSTSA